MEPRFVLFDFDGVIVDSVKTLFGVAQVLHPHFTQIDEWLQLFEGNIFTTHEAAWTKCTESCRPAHDAFFELYSPQTEGLRVFDGMAQVIEDLAAQYTLAIVSSTDSRDARAVLARSGLSDAFAEVYGKDVHTSKVEKFAMAQKRHDFEPHQCVFVTDTLGDIKEAREAGIDAIAVSWGFHAVSKLESGNPYRIAQKPIDLPGIIENYFAEKYVSA